MDDLSLMELQKAVDDFYKKKGFICGVTTLALGLSEEVGELAEAILVLYTPDYISIGKKSTIEFRKELDIASEIGDCMTYLLSICNKLGISPKFNWHEAEQEK